MGLLAHTSPILRKYSKVLESPIDSKGSHLTTYYSINNSHQISKNAIHIQEHAIMTLTPCNLQ